MWEEQIRAGCEVVQRSADDYAGFKTVQTEAQMGPPMLKVAATLGFLTCNSGGTLPSNCHADQPSMAMPVAPTG